MRAMVLDRQPGRLTLQDRPVPEPSPGQVLIRVRACGACRTDVHIADGDLAGAGLPLIPGHQIVGTVEGTGDAGAGGRFAAGQRIGVPWLGWTDGTCRFCRAGKENLCENARFTGYHLDGGFADFCVADERFCFELPEALDDLHVAPLLCAGLIGYRALRIAGDGERLGLYGFGSSAHILCQLAAAEGRSVFAFTRPGDRPGQAFARSLGAKWAGDSTEAPPEPLDAAIVFAPVGSLMIEALKASGPGARVVSAGIHMSEIPAFPYELLWEERSLHSVANLTREDGRELLGLASRHRIEPTVEAVRLEEADSALERIRTGAAAGSTVLKVSG